MFDLERLPSAALLFIHCNYATHIAMYLGTRVVHYFVYNLCIQFIFIFSSHEGEIC